MDHTNNNSIKSKQDFIAVVAFVETFAEEHPDHLPFPTEEIKVSAFSKAEALRMIDEIIKEKQDSFTWEWAEINSIQKL